MDKIFFIFYHLQMSACPSGKCQSALVVQCDDSLVSVVGAELGTPHHHDEDAGLVPGRGAAAGRNPGQVLQNQVQQLR